MKIEIYTDGSSLGNPGRGGWGSVVVHSDKIIHELGGFEKDTTNNRMELQAVIGSLEYVSKKKDTKEVTIYADSAYVLGGVTSWVASWEKNGWKTSKKEPVLNQDLWKILIALVRGSQTTLSWQKVKGHAGHVYNERADEIATSCAELQKNITL
jgi:ribonuclease HI